MSQKLYIGNLNWDATEDDLKELFADYGEIEEVVIVKDKFNRSKGFAFVTLQDDDQAQNAISNLNGNDFMNRPLVVDVARPSEKKKFFKKF